MNDDYLGDIETKIEPAQAPDPKVFQVPFWKKVVLVGAIFAVYIGLVCLFVFSSGGAKLIGLLLLVCYTFLVKPLLKVLRRILKFPDLSD